MSKKVLVVDSQLYDAMQLCPQKYDIAFNNCLRPATKKPALESGSMNHDFLETYYLSLKDGLEFQAALDAAYKRGLETAATLESVPVEETEWELESLVRYARYHRFDNWEPLEVERSFFIKIYEDDEIIIYLAGKIDLIVNTQNLRRVPVDHKTYSRWMDPNKANNQFLFYAIATESSYLIVNRIGLQKTLSDQERFRRVILSYTKTFLAREKQNIIWWIRDNHKFYLETGTWPLNRTSCDKFGGCDFRPICNAEDEQSRQFVIDSQFVKGEMWDPTKVLEKKIPLKLITE